MEIRQLIVDYILISLLCSILRLFSLITSLVLGILLMNVNADESTLDRIQVSSRLFICSAAT